MKQNKLLLIILSVLLLLQSSFAITSELISTNPTPIVAGDYADITLRFSNPASSNINSVLKNVKFGIEKTDFIQPISKVQSLSKIQSGVSITRTFRVFFSKDLEQGFIDLPVFFDYGSTHTSNLIQIYVQNSQTMPEMVIGQITTIPNEILQDTKNNKLSISLQNLGDKSADLIKVDLIPQTNEIYPSYSYSFEDSIASIASGAEGIATFTLDVKPNVQSEIPAKLLLRYRAKDSVGNTYHIINKTIDFKIPITPAPFLVVENVTQLSDFKIGSTENLLKIRIKNNGAEDAKEVRVRAVPDISYPLIFEETTMYVTSKLKPGQSTDIIFKIEVSKTGQVRDYNSILILDSLVGETRYSREDNFSVTTSPGKNVSVSFYAYLIVIVVIVVSTIIGINTYNSRKKNKK